MYEEMHRTREVPGYVKVQNEALFNSLFGDDDDDEDKSKGGGSGKHGSPASLSQHEIRSKYLKKAKMRESVNRQADMAMVREKRFLQHKEKVDRQMKENSRKVKEKVAEIAMRKEENFRKMREDITRGSRLANRVGVWLQNHETAKEVKVKKQYDTWNSDIYNTINDKIHSELNAKNYQDIHKNKLKHYDKFLEVTNAKGSVFRDIIIESEYDPLQPNREDSIKVRTEVLKDPIKRSIQRTLEEKGLSKDVLHPRETLDVLEWATGKIEATPHGFFAKMMREGRRANAQKSKTMESRVGSCLDQYDIARGRAVLDKEFPAGKRTKHPPRRAEKFELS